PRGGPRRRRGHRRHQGAPARGADPRARAAVVSQDPRGRDPERGAGRGAGKKTAVALAVARSGRFPMKAIAPTLGVAPSNVVERTRGGGTRPRPPYRKAGDAELLARIRPLVDARPSYGNRRTTAILNRLADTE